MAGALAARLLIVASLVLAACSSATLAEPAADTRPEFERVELDNGLVEAFEEWESRAEGGGIAFVGQVGGDHVTTAVGVDATSGAALSPLDPVRVGSISKIVTSTLVMQLVDKGMVDLKEPISTYVDLLGIENDPTVNELLSHRSGVPNYTDSPGFFEVVLRNPDREPSPDDLLNFVSGADFAAGEQFAYSNTNYIILGMLLEEVTGQSLAGLLSSQISEPLGLSRTAFDDGTIDDVPSGYSRQVASGTSGGQSYTSIAYGAWSAGSLVTTVEELAIFLDALFFGNIVSSESRALMLAPLDAGKEYGLGLHPGPDFGVGHGGSIIGYNSIAEVDLDTGVIVIVVVNNDARRPDVASGILAEFVDG